MYCAKCGKPLAAGAAFCSYCGAAAADPAAAPSRAIPDDPGGVAARVRKNEIIVNVAWLVMGVVQVALLYTAAAGVWNIVNAILFLRNAKNIVPGNPGVVPYFEGRKTGLIIMGVVNLVLGGVVGVVLVLYELHVRQIVLDNAGAFDPAAAPVAAERAAAADAAKGFGCVSVTCPACSAQYTIRYKKAAASNGTMKITCPKCKAPFTTPVS